MYKIQGKVLFVVLALLAGTAQAARTAKVEGTITAVSAASLPPTVTITSPSGVVTLKVVASTKIEVGDDRGSLVDLALGADAKAHFDLNTLVARKIEVEGTAASATVTGRVLSASSVSEAVTLDTTGDGVLDLTLTTNSDTRIKVGGIALTTAELDALVGLRVRVEYLTATFLATKIEASESAAVSARGTVTAVDPVAGTLEIGTTAGPLAFDVAAGAEIRIGGQRVGLPAVQVGDTVHVTYLDAEVNVAVRILVQPPRPLHVTGTVTAADSVAGTLTVSRGSASIVLVVTANTDLRINGRAATVADVQAAIGSGRQVKASASYFLRAGVNLATDVRVNVHGRGRG